MVRSVSVEQWGQKPNWSQFKRECEGRKIERAMCRLLFQEAKLVFQLFFGMWFPVLCSTLVVPIQTSSYFSMSLATECNPQTEFINTESSRSISPPILEALFLLLQPKTTFALWETVLYSFGNSVEMESGISAWSVGSKTQPRSKSLEGAQAFWQDIWMN